jgi:hypothetical protein
MLVEITDGFFCDPELVAVVKATGKNKSALFTAGQSAVDGGFALPYEAAEVTQEINDALDRMGEVDQIEGGDEDD